MKSLWSLIVGFLLGGFAQIIIRQAWPETIMSEQFIAWFIWTALFGLLAAALSVRNA